MINYSKKMFRPVKTETKGQRTVRHEESRIQSACVKWFSCRYPELQGLLFSVPNGARVRLSQARILKLEGLTRGVSDLILLIPRGRYHALCIEMKTEKGRQSTEQKTWQKTVERFEYKYIVCRSLADFRQTINDYLTMPF